MVIDVAIAKNDNDTFFKKIYHFFDFTFKSLKCINCNVFKYHSQKSHQQNVLKYLSPHLKKNYHPAKAQLINIQIESRNHSSGKSYFTVSPPPQINAVETRTGFDSRKKQVISYNHRRKVRVQKQLPNNLRQSMAGRKRMNIEHFPG